LPGIGIAAMMGACPAPVDDVSEKNGIAPMTSPARPLLALRVGVTGTRNLAPDEIERLSGQLDAVLGAAQAHVQHLARYDNSVASAYFHPPALPTQPVFRFLSPLARGADRLAAKAALALGYRLHVPMPFAQAEYEKDFDTPADLAEFHAVLAQARDGIIALDGDHGTEMNRSYEAVGRYVVRHCDVLIAIWDGRPSGGQGGTADIVHYAALGGVPIWWLHATEAREPRWIADIQDLRDPLPGERPAMDSLTAYLTKLVRPYPPCVRERHGVIGRLARLCQRLETSPETEHFAERPLKKRWLWTAYARMIRWTSGRDVPWTPPRRPTDPVEMFWFTRYEPTDDRAGEYARRYRSTYVWVFVLATSALFFGALASMHPSMQVAHEIMEVLSVFCIVLEAVALLLILGVVGICMRREWHEHSIEYRLLAELYRKQQVLAPLGWALPITAVWGMASGDGPTPHRGAWVGWLFAADQRAAPFPKGELAHAARGAPRAAVLQDLIEEQLEYHQGRSEMAEGSARFLEGWGERVFCAIGVCVVLKMILVWWLGWPDLGLLFGFFAIVLPAVSAAFVGIRAYAELPLLAEESRHMVAELERARTRLLRLNPVRPLASQELGAEAAVVATLMLQELQGWARVFRVKSMEAS
jgi:hypothetical protein